MKIAIDKNWVALFILAILTFLQLLFYWRYLQDFNQVLIQAIFIVGIFWQVWQKQRQLKPVSDLPGNLLGITLILLLLLRAKYIFLVEASVFSYFSPWLILIGYILVIAGLKGIKQYRREIIVCFVITTIPGLSAILTRISDASHTDQFVEVISAKLTSFLLWYLGFDVSSQGTLVYVNNGAIDIYWGCTAIPLLAQLLRISLLTVLLFSNLCRHFLLPFILSFVISLVFSIIRLAIMALVVNDEAAFGFWHGLDGGNLFLTLALVTFFAIIIGTSPPQNKNLNSVLPKYQTKTPAWLLLSSSVALLFILFNFITDNSLIAGANSIAEYQFPAVINLSGWQLDKRTEQPLISLPKDDNMPSQQTATDFDLSLAQRSYLYKKDNDELTLSLRYIVNTLGDIKAYYSAFENIPGLRNYTEVKNEDNYYLKFVNQGKQYWTACLNVEGKTTVTVSQFFASLAQGTVKPTKLLNWLLGQQALRDRRCLWIELSTPENSTLTDSDRRKTWQIIIDYWRSHFPPLRGVGVRSNNLTSDS